MKKVTCLLFLLVGVSLQLNADICQCGDYATGTTTYQVIGEDCCTGELSGTTGTQTVWIKGQGRTWRVLSSVEVVASVAQATCCD